MPRLNIKVRAKSVLFWFFIIEAVFMWVDVDASTLTSWSILLDTLKSILMNPYKLGLIAVNLLGIAYDPTTSGLSDSIQALTYNKARKSM